MVRRNFHLGECNVTRLTNESEKDVDDDVQSSDQQKERETSVAGEASLSRRRRRSVVRDDFIGSTCHMSAQSLSFQSFRVSTSLPSSVREWGVKTGHVWGLVFCSFSFFFLSHSFFRLQEEKYVNTGRTFLLQIKRISFIMDHFMSHAPVLFRGCCFVASACVCCLCVHVVWCVMCVVAISNSRVERRVRQSGWVQRTNSMTTVVAFLLKSSFKAGGWIFFFATLSFPTWLCLDRWGRISEWIRELLAPRSHRVSCFVFTLLIQANSCVYVCVFFSFIWSYNDCMTWCRHSRLRFHLHLLSCPFFQANRSQMMNTIATHRNNRLMIRSSGGSGFRGSACFCHRCCCFACVMIRKGGEEKKKIREDSRKKNKEIRKAGEKDYVCVCNLA